MNYSFVKNQITKFNKIAEEFRMPKLYVVGGLCRDMIFSDGNIQQVNDIDLTCCDGAKTTMLGLLLGKELNGSIAYFNNHCSVIIDDVKYDFSSGYINSEVSKKIWIDLRKKCFQEILH